MNRRLPAVAVSFALASFAAHAGQTVSTFDGLSLAVDAEGRIAGVGADGAQLPVIGPGGFFVSEVLPTQAPLPQDGASRPAVPVIGTAALTAPNEVTLNASLAELGVTFTGVIRGGTALQLDVELVNTRGGDRAFSVYFRVPVNAAGWRWSGSLSSSKNVTGSARLYDAFHWFQAYRTTTSAAPVVTLANQDVGMALVVPPTAPAIYRLSWEPNAGLQLEWEVGTAPEPMRFPNAARMQALFYRVDPKLPFRSALKRLYLMHPELWTKRGKDGAWYYGNSSAIASIANPADFALQWAETYDWSTDFTRAHGVYTLKYVEPWNDHLERDPAGLAQWAQDSASNQSWAMISKGQPRQIAAQAALLSGVIGRDGEYAGYSDPVNFTDPEGTHRYVLNPDWELPNFLGFTADYTDVKRVLNRGQSVEEYEVLRQWGRHPSGPNDTYSGLYLDSTNGSGSGWDGWHLFNFRREHFNTTRAMLVFDPKSGKVALSQALSSLESVRHLAELMHQKGSLIMANGGADPFIYTTAAYCDFVSVGEHYTGDLVRMRAIRAALYDKPSSYLYNGQVTDQQFQHALIYAVFPGGAGEEQNRAVYKRWAPLMLRVAGAGWEPLTYAVTSDAGVLVERYGRADEGNLTFVLHREAGTSGAVQVALDKAKLGLGEGVQVSAQNLVDGSAVTLTDEAGLLTAPLWLSTEQTAVLALTVTAGTAGPTEGDLLPLAPVAQNPDDPADTTCGVGCAKLPPAIVVEAGNETSTEPLPGTPANAPVVHGRSGCGGCSSGEGATAALALAGLALLLGKGRRAYFSKR